MEGDFFDRLMDSRPLRWAQPFFRKYREQILYILFSDLTLLISIGSFWLLVYPLHIPPLAANPLTWILRVAFAYLTNRKWVFRKKAHDAKGIAREAASFAAARLVTLFLEELILGVGIEVLHFNSMLVKIIAQITVFVGNYIGSKLFVFREK